MNPATILTDARKALTAFVGAAGEVLALGLLHGTAERWTTTAVGIATAVLVAIVPNGKKTVAGQRVLVDGRSVAKAPKV